MCQVYAVAADHQHTEGGYLPPPTMVSVRHPVRFLGLVPPVLLERPRVYLSSEYQPYM